MTAPYSLHFRVLPSERCTCTSERDSDGAEQGMCTYCESAADDELYGNRDMLNELHARPGELHPEGPRRSQSEGIDADGNCMVCGGDCSSANPPVIFCLLARQRKDTRL